jgi:hypothetical protein
MTKDQLTVEAKKLNHRLSELRKACNFNLTNILKSRKQLAVSKHKEELIIDILIEAIWWTDNSPKLSWFDHIDRVSNLESVKRGDDFTLDSDSESEQVANPPREELAASTEDEMVLLSDSDDDDDGDGCADSTLLHETHEKTSHTASMPTSTAEKNSLNSHSIAMSDLLRNTALWYFGYSSFRDGQR